MRALSRSANYVVAKDDLGLKLSLQAEILLTLRVPAETGTKQGILVNPNLFVFQSSTTVPCNLLCVYAKAWRPYCFGQHRFLHKRQNTKTHTWQARISPHMLRTTFQMAGMLQLPYRYTMYTAL